MYFGNKYHNKYTMKKILLMMIVAVIGTISANAQFKIGDIYNQSNLKGLVVDVDASGKHGLILSLSESTYKKCLREE